MGPFGSFLTSILLQNRQKNEGWTLWRYLRKKSHKAKKNLHKKILVMVGLEPMSFCLSDLEKAVVAKWQWSSVAQFSVSAGLVPTYKIYKICQFVGLKKKEVTTIVCVFLRKAPTKKKTALRSCKRSISFIQAVVHGKNTKFECWIVNFFQRIVSTILMVLLLIFNVWQ